MTFETVQEKCLSLFIVPLYLGPQQNTYIFIQTSCPVDDQSNNWPAPVAVKFV